MAKKVQKATAQEGEVNLRPEGFPPPPFSKDGRGRGPLETLSPTNTIIIGMVLVVLGAFLAAVPWIFKNGEGVGLYVSLGALIFALGGFLGFVGYQKEEWRKKVKEWIKTAVVTDLESLDLPEWLMLEEIKTGIPVLPPGGVIPESPKLNTHNVDATHLTLPDLSEMEGVDSFSYHESNAIEEDVEENPTDLFKDEPEPNFEQFWDDSDDYDEEVPPVSLPDPMLSSEAAPSGEQALASSAEPVEPPVPQALITPEKDFLDDYLEEMEAREQNHAPASSESSTEEVPKEDAPRGDENSLCGNCGHRKAEHSTKGTCVICLMSDDDDQPVCESFREKE